MKRLVYVASLLTLTAFTSPDVAAGSYHWIGGDQDSGGGWNTAANWINDATKASELPTPGSIAVVTNSVVVNDDDVALFSSLKRVKLDKWNSDSKTGAIITLDVSTNVVIGCAVNGLGRFEKKGSGRAVLTAADTADAFTNYYQMPGVYYLVGGDIHVKAGTLELVKSAGYQYNYGNVHVSQGAVVVLNSDNATCIEALYGSGTVIQEGETERKLQIAYTRRETPVAAEFAGKITGKINIQVWGNQIFSGTENDFTGSISVTYGAGLANYGRLGVAKLGMRGEISSLGVKDTFILMGYGGNFSYLGNGETSDRPFVTSAENNTGLCPQYFDAGENGGLRLTGLMELRPYASAYNMRSFVFTGSNKVACTMAGPFNLGMTDPTDGARYDFYVRKEGPGEWVFEKNDQSTFCGVFDVREGTLSFDSIANAGVLCALGYSTRLSDEFSGKWDGRTPSRYAFRVGTTNLLGAAKAVFAFVGGASCASADRPLLLTGDACLRANGKDDAAIDFADVSAAAGESVKTLTIDGTNTSDNVIRDVVDGDGRVALVKDGPGKWTLQGDQTFSGSLTVKAGELCVDSRKANSWYRLTIRKNAVSGGVTALSRVAFYDAEGKLLTKGVKFVCGQQYADKQNYYYAVDPSRLDFGQCCWAPFSDNPQMDNYYTKIGSEDPDILFNGGGGGGSRLYYCKGDTVCTFNGTNPGARLVFRLPQGSAEAVRYDLGSWIVLDNWLAWRTTAWTVEGSPDGVNWQVLDEVEVTVDGEDDVKVSQVWYSDPKQTISLDDRSGGGFELDLPSPDVQLDNIESLAVWPGAKLTITGQSTLPPIKKIVIDAVGGAGRIAGGEFAEDLVVDIVGDVPRRGVTLPVDFAGVGNIDGVRPSFRFNSEVSKRYTCNLSAGRLEVKPVGLILMVK